MPSAGIAQRKVRALLLKAWPMAGHRIVVAGCGGGEGGTKEVVTIGSDDDIMACHSLTNQSLCKLCIIIAEFGSVI
jgi:hypothetical protein